MSLSFAGKQGRAAGKLANTAALQQIDVRSY